MAFIFETRRVSGECSRVSSKFIMHDQNIFTKKLCLVTASRKLYKKKLAHTIVALW